MKNLSKDLCLLTFIIGNLNFFVCNGQSRIVMNIDDQWKFKYSEETGAESPELNDNAWEIISLPHTWNNLDGQDGQNDYERGTGWYRKRIEGLSPYQGKRLFIRFGAANLVATVYVNGQEIGTHYGGYASFIYDITSNVSYNAPNVIAVKVNNKNTENISPISGDFTFCGGLTRSVELVVTNQVAITLTDYASPGIYITQNNVNREIAEFSVKTLIRNYNPNSQTIEKIINIIDADNHLVQSNSEIINLQSDSQTERMNDFVIYNPVLWNGLINPYLYKVQILLKKDGQLLDSLSQPLGLRFFEISADSGLYLNGKRFPLYGVNHHEDMKDKGRAISRNDRLQDFNLIKEMGTNFIRLVHYQHDEYTYSLADKYGMILWTEIPVVNRIDNTALFEENSKEQLKELIRQNYNHPSVFFWGLCNEILHDDGPDPLALLTELNALAHIEDPTRPTTLATNKDDKVVNEVADLVSFNKYYGWYSGTPSYFKAWLSDMKSDPLSIPVGVSEYGAGGSILHHELEAVMPNTRSEWHPEELLNEFHESYWARIAENPFLWQSSAWVSFDFASDSRKEGDHFGINDKGLITQDRKVKKDVFYFYKSQWTDDPVVYITSRRFNERTDPDTYVKVYSNCDSVELLINDQLFACKQSENRVFKWDNISLSPGINIIKAIGFKNQSVIRDSCIWKCDTFNVSGTIRINFQTPYTETPSGYEADSGQVYNTLSGGLIYGWNVDNRLNARERLMWPDKNYDTFNHFQKSDPANFWEIALRNGSYLVQIAAGDPLFYDGYQKIMAEGEVIVEGTTSQNMPWIINQRIVEVKDGKLTITAGDEAVNAKINFIHISRTDSSNLGINKKVSQSSTDYGGSPERAIDGKTDGRWDYGSVIHTQNDLNAWWEIDLGDVYDINSIQIWNRTDDCCKDRLSNFYLFVSDVAFASRELDITINQPGVSNFHISDYPDPCTTINTSRTARYIRIQLAGSNELNIAEIIIMGPNKKLQPTKIVNVALNKTVKQSSTRYEGIPERAVDGNTNGLWHIGSVSHTGRDVNAWWEVDLGNVYFINTIELWNRTNECCKDRLSDFYVIASEVPFASQQLEATLNQPDVWYVFQSDYPDPVDIFKPEQTARYIRIQSSKTTELNIAELIVMGSESLKNKSSKYEKTQSNKAESFEISIYPIPFKDVLHIKSMQSISKVEFINVLGEVVKTVESRDLFSDINTGLLAPGFYVIRIKNNENAVKVITGIKQE